MAKILGLDLGTNSIGWAIRDTMVEENQMVDKGVLTFEKGVAEGKSGEFPMVQKRTESRGKRRNYQAEKYRKWELLETLIENKMCPLTVEELNEWRHYKKGIGRKYPQSEKFIQWLRFDFDGDGKPDFERFGFSKHESLYVFRMLATSDDEQSRRIFKNEPQILGRVLYQLVQRRGFRGRDEDESKTIMQGGGDSGAKGVNEIASYREKHKTLGAALYHLQKETGERIRKRYNLRSDYEQELKIISELNGLGEELYNKLWKAIIWQRPLRSQKGLVGICTFQKNKSRAPVSHPFYEEYRTWVFINNLKISLPASVNREEYLSGTIYPLFYNASRDFKLKKINDRLKKDGGSIEAKFNDDTKVISCTLLNDFQKLLGPDWKEKYGWFDALTNKPQKPGYTFEDIWHVLATFDSREKLKEFALTKLSLSEDAAETFSKIKLQQGYATLSISAIKKLLPYLKKGFKYSHAVYMANMHKVLNEKLLNDEMATQLAEAFDKIEKEVKKQRTIDEIVNNLVADHQNTAQRWGMDESYQLDKDDYNDIEQKTLSIIGEKTWCSLLEEEKQTILSPVAIAYQTYLQQRVNTPLAKIFSKKERLHDALFNYLKDTYGLSDEMKKYLWHPSEQETYTKATEVNGVKLLGEPQPISRGFKNPMALKTLHQLKKLLNYLLSTGKIDEETRVVVEIARELNDANRRKAIERWQKKREEENKSFQLTIDEINAGCNTSFNREDKNLIDKVRLWKEQNMRCIYTGTTINLCDVFNGLQYDIEHTVSAKLSFDNELKNLTLANAWYNRQVKQKQLPSQCPNYESEQFIDGKRCTSIRGNMEFLFGKRTIIERTVKGKTKTVESYEKIEQLETQVDFWLKQTKIAPTKERKDYCIQQRHFFTFELEYWRKKLETFTIEEYKAGWRNSQLRDTQVITKYALPYLKTVFNKVDVQKASVTASFREVYKIQPRMERKNRTKHSHHAIDAAVLTLIPPATIRDKILLRFNEEKDNNPYNTYHESVRDWKSFNAEHILGIEDDVLINFQPKQRTLTPTYKNVRKRGRQQFVKEKSAEGKWQFKLDDKGNKIPLKAEGNAIRGQLHKESFFGTIKLNGEQLLVERYPIAAFTKIEDCKNIVDDAVRKIVEETLKERMKEGLSFDKAKLDPISIPNGKALIKKVRCKVAAGRGYLTPAKALEIRQHDFKSKHDYKNSVYAQNDENTLCLYYEGEIDGKVERAFRIVGLFELAQLNLKKAENIREEEYYKTIMAGRGKAKGNILLDFILQAGAKVILYEERIDELKELSAKQLSKRLYRIFKFNEPAPSTVYCYLQHHAEARPNDELGNGEKDVDFNKYQQRLFLGASKFNCAIEGKHFEVKPDGEIKWLI